jgi:hypothetical protein
MARDADPNRRLQRRLAVHQALHDPAIEPRNRSPRVADLRRWQAWRLERSFRGLLEDPCTAPAARFFLTDVYGDYDFSGRDADIARVLPTMQRLLPGALLGTVADGVGLAALSHAFDLRMAAALERLAPAGADLDVALYAHAYREVGLPRLRGRQVALVQAVGSGLAVALRQPGIGTLLRVSRGPARAMGLGELQGFLERGVAAFRALGDARGFVEAIAEGERRASAKLFAGEPDPFGWENASRRAAPP